MDEEKQNLIKIDKENQVIIASINKDVQKDNYSNGCELERWTTINEDKTLCSFEDLKQWVEGFGLDIEDFERFDTEEETSRLTYCRDEDGEGNEITLTKLNPDGFLCDYDLYLDVYTIAKDKDYLESFKNG